MHSCKVLKLTDKTVASIIELNPPPTEQICQQFNELRSDIVLHYELRSALSTCDYELQSLRHQYEALVPGKVIVKYNILNRHNFK